MDPASGINAIEILSYASAVLIILLILMPVFVYQCAAYTRRIWKAQQETNRLLAEQTAVTQKLIDKIEAAARKPRPQASGLRQVG